jgi:hypothetical protein
MSNTNNWDDFRSYWNSEAAKNGAISGAIGGGVAGIVAGIIIGIVICCCLRY